MLSLFGRELVLTTVEYDIADAEARSASPKAFDIRYDAALLCNRTAERVADELTERGIFECSIAGQYRPRHLREFAKRAVIKEIETTARYITIVNYEIESERSEDVYLLLRSNFISSHLAAANSNDTYALVWYPDLNRFLDLLRNFAQIVREMVYATIRVFSATEKPSGTQKRIAVQYLQGVDFESQNDIPWYPESSISPEQILLYSNGQESPPPETVAEIKKRGFGWRQIKGWHPRIGGVSYLREVGQCAVSIFVTVSDGLRSISSLSVWAWGQLIWLDVSRVRWKCFFRQFNIAAHFDYTESEPVRLAKVTALEQVGAISVGYQWTCSDMIFPAGHRFMIDHVHFVWGDLQLSSMEQREGAPDTTLVCGHMYDYIPEQVRRSAAKRNRTLKRNGCDAVICLFDNSFADNIHFTAEIMEEFYETFYELASQYSSLGLIIKPKTNSQLKDLDNVDEKLRELERRGQCLILDSETTTVEAALSADLTAGIGVSSAVIQGIAAGVPGIHVDLAGMDRGFPFYQEWDETLIHNSSSEVTATIERWLNDQTVPLTNQANITKKIDPFRDGMSGARIGLFLGEYLRALEAGLESHAARQASIEKYAHFVGKKYINSNER